MTSIKLSLYAILVIAAFASCSGDPEKETEQVDINKEVSTEVHEEEEPTQEVQAPEEDDVWGVYEGFLGLYEQHVVMEISIRGEEFSGTYFYSKHQKPLTLKGTYDPETNMIKATESYKGKSTGYLEFTLIRGEIEGNWMKKKGAKDQERFTATLVGVDKEDYHPIHNRYEVEHEISIYNGDQGESIEDVTDVLTVNKVGQGYFSFYYSVTGANAHVGSAEGFGEIGDDDRGIFRGEDNCVLEFNFSKNTVEVHETDCQYYRGARAYFDRTLTKVK